MDAYVAYLCLLTDIPGRKRDEATIRAHVAHLKRLEDAGDLIVCGPFSDYPGGMAVFRAESDEAVRALAEADPFVAGGFSRYELRRLHISCKENNHMGFGD